jgi:branched-chain amino acid transport system ATP-binding protein
MLSIKNLHSGYGDVRILQGIDLTVRPGEVTVIVGANGVGKTTLLRTIAGLLKPHAGSITYKDEEIGGIASHDIVERGIILVPEGRRLFPRMSVLHNLELGAFAARARRDAAARLEVVYKIFPVLKERARQLGGTLSGGQQQMCAIGRGMMGDPQVLMLDEVSLGLAPVMVNRVYEAVRAIRDSGVTLIIVEQNVGHALSVADHGYVISEGKVVMSGTGKELLANPDVRRAYMGLGH